MKKNQPKPLQFTLTATDHARAARLMLATLRGDRQALDQVLAEANEIEGGTAALVFALTWYGVQVSALAAVVAGSDPEVLLENSLLSLLDEHQPPAGLADPEPTEPKE